MQNVSNPLEILKKFRENKKAELFCVLFINSLLGLKDDSRSLLILAFFFCCCWIQKVLRLRLRIKESTNLFALYCLVIVWVVSVSVGGDYLYNVACYHLLAFHLSIHSSVAVAVAATDIMVKQHLMYAFHSAP